MMPFARRRFPVLTLAAAAFLAACSSTRHLATPPDYARLVSEAPSNSSDAAIEQTWLTLRVQPDAHRYTGQSHGFMGGIGLNTVTLQYDITDLVRTGSRAAVYSAFADPGARTRQTFTATLEVYRSQLVIRGSTAHYTIDGRLTIADDLRNKVYTKTATVQRSGGAAGGTLPRVVPEAIAEFMRSLVDDAVRAPEVAQACEDYLRARKPHWDMPAQAAVGRVPAPPESGRVYALLVGIGDYQSNDIPSLRYAASDARAMHRSLVESGVRESDILLLVNDEATLKGIRGAISNHLAQAQREDTVIVYFSCHGSADAETLAAREYHDGFEKFLLTYNADPKALAGSALSMSELKADIDRLASDRVVLIVDSCYAGEAADVAGAKTYRRQGATHYKAVNLVDDYAVKFVPAAEGTSGGARAVVVLAGSQANQVSREGDQWGGSLFTHYVVRGISGESDTNGDGAVEVDELYGYVREAVARESRSKQTPIVFPARPPFPVHVTPRK